MKPIAASCLFLLLLFCSPSVHGQGENNIWCFGFQDKLDFTAGPPVSGTSGITGYEGCASVCDAAGNLLFYAHNMQVWSRNNVLMPNGSGLAGDGSPTQGVAIIQSFADPDMYYLFTMKDIVTNTPGQPTLFYSVIDMNLNNGYGDVVTGQKNIPIDTDVYEKLIVVKGSGCYNWLLTHRASSPVFHAFKVDAAGVASQPVVSTSGFMYTSNAYGIGEMKVSPDNQSIILVNNNFLSHNLELHSFDNFTGVVSNAIDFDTVGVSTWYGTSFSPDGSKLYIGVKSGPNGIYQYDMSLMPNITAVQNSRTLVYNSDVILGMRMGPDNKVYVLLSSGNVSVINNPNMAGPACNFVPGIIQLLDNPAEFGNQFVSNGPTGPTNNSHDTTACLFSPITISSIPGYATYTWSDGTTQVSDTITVTGTKWVVATSSCSIRTDTFHVTVLPATFTSEVTDTTICFVNNVAILSAQAGYTSYLWSDGKTTLTDTASQPGTKWVQAQIQASCTMLVDTFKLHAMPMTTTSSVTDTTACLVDNVPMLTATTAATTYLWSDGKTTQTDTMSAVGTKWVQAQTGCTMHVDTFHLHAMPITTTSFAKDTSACFINNTPILSAPSGYNTYLWSDGKTTQQDTMSMPGTKWAQSQTGCNMRVDTFHVHDWRDTTKMVLDTSHCVAYSPITIYAPGGYTSYLWSDGKTTQVDTFFGTTTKWVTALNGCDMLIDTVHFTATTVPNDSITLHGTDTVLCFENVTSVNVSAPGGYTYYLWSDGTTLQTDAFAGPGTKWVYAQKLCALLIDTFAVLAKPTDTTGSRIDTMICFSAQATLNAVQGYDTYLWSDGNATQSDTFTGTTTKLVYAHKACAERIDTFHVQFINDLSVNLGNDTFLCKGEVIKLAATTYTGATYLWQDNSTAKVYNVTDGGDYSVKVSVGPCSVRDTIRVHQKVIDVKLENGLIPCNEHEIILDAGVDSGSYLWQDGSTQRTFKATKEGTYSVKVTQGICHTTASANVKFDDCPCIVVLPTAFSPNGDGKNDVFGARISCDVSTYKFMVYNRWGNQVFYTENVDDKWDGSRGGKVLGSDVYNYYMEFKDAEGKSYYYKGDVTLVR